MHGIITVRIAAELVFTSDGKKNAHLVTAESPIYETIVIKIDSCFSTMHTNGCSHAKGIARHQNTEIVKLAKRSNMIMHRPWS